MRFPLVLFSFALLLPAFLTACGGDDDNDSTPSAGVGTGNDADYLAAICQGTSEFSNALLSKTTADEIADVIRAFITRMKAVNPPADLVKYNQDFVKYLEDSVNDPTSLVTRQPPLPPDDVRQRLAAKEPTVPECKDPTFFSRDASGG